MHVHLTTRAWRFRHRVSQFVERSAFFCCGYALATGFTGWTVAGVLALLMIAAAVAPEGDW